MAPSVIPNIINIFKINIQLEHIITLLPHMFPMKICILKIIHIFIVFLTFQDQKNKNMGKKIVFFRDFNVLLMYMKYLKAPSSQ